MVISQLCGIILCFKEKNQAVAIGKQIIEKKPESCFVFLYFLFCHSVPSVPAPSFVLRKLKKEKREKSSVFQIQSTVGGRRGKKLTTKQPLGTEVAFRREYLSTPRKCEPGEIENKGTFMNFQRTCLPHESPDAFGHAALTIFERGCSGWGYCWLQQTRWFDSRLKMTYL